MDLKVVFVIVFLSSLAISSTDAGIPKCCIGVKDKLLPHLRRKIDRWERQYSTGACDIDALLVFIKNRVKPICLAPKLEKSLKTSKQTKPWRY